MSNRDLQRKWRRGAVHRAAAPVTWGALTPAACAGLVLATRAPTGPSPTHAFRTHERLYEAHARGDVALDATVRVASRTSTAGRHLVLACLPPSIAATQPDAVWTAHRVEHTLACVARTLHVEHAARSAAALEALGRLVIERSGCSLAQDDFAPSEARAALRAEGFADTSRIAREYDDGLITDGERSNKLIDIWAAVADRERYALRKQTPVDDPLQVFTLAVTDGASAEKLRAPGGVATDAQGSLSERPVLHSVGDGFDAHDAMQRWSTRRRDQLRADERDAIAATLLHDLDAVLGGVTVVMHDCGTRRGVRLARHASLSDRDFTAALEGRVAAADVVAADGTVLAHRGALLDVPLVEAIVASDAVAVFVRDPTGCEARDGVCACCLGLDPDDFTWTQPGDAVGARAAQRIAHEARNFHVKWFHIC